MAYNPLPIFCTIKPSFIDGLGLFATREIKKVEVNNKWYLKTTKDIMPNDELTLTYSLYKPE
jgi:hypothetical protein